MKKLLLATVASAALAGAASAEDVKLGIFIGFTGPIESLTGHMAAAADMMTTTTTIKIHPKQNRSESDYYSFRTKPTDL